MKVILKMGAALALLLVLVGSAGALAAPAHQALPAHRTTTTPIQQLVVIFD